MSMTLSLKGPSGPKVFRYLVAVAVLWMTALVLLAFKDTIVPPIEYKLVHLFHTQAELDEMNATSAMLAHVHAFRVACPDPGISAADRARWDVYAAQKGWTAYPAAGAGCVDP